MLRALLFASVPALLLPALPAMAQTTGDAAAGEALARRWCAGCHIVTPEQTRGTTEAPTFPNIARSRPIGPDDLAVTLSVPHPVMPEVPLSRKTLEDISAYLRSLKAE